MPASLAERLLAGSRSDLDALWTEMHSHPDGITDEEASAIRERVGPNEVDHERPLPWWVHLWQCYRTPFSLLLTVLAVVSYLTEDVKATVVISSMVVLATLIRFWQEGKSNRAADKLKAMVSNTATVLRRNRSTDVANDADGEAPPASRSRGQGRVELPIVQLVPGDVVVLSAGDMIPADCRRYAKSGTLRPPNRSRCRPGHHLTHPSRVQVRAVGNSDGAGTRDAPHRLSVAWSSSFLWHESSSTFDCRDPPLLTNSASAL